MPPSAAFPAPASTLLFSASIEAPVTTAVGTPISLSDGLGPLLSSTMSLASGAPTTSSGLILSLVAGSTTIQVVSSRIAATVASSVLTTSGIPGSLTVNLSTVSSDAVLESSVALISFGTSSPAIFSTILPAGASRGTSSETIAAYSTVALNGLSLTGVTLLAPRSPTSCFTLPTPVSSMDMLAIAVVPETDYNLANPMILGFGDNGTVPVYISALASGNPYVLDLSSGNAVTGQLGLQIPGDEALVFDGTGMSLYTGNCSTLTQVAIDNFYSQLRILNGGSSSAITLKNPKRQAASTTNFTVDVAVDSYLKTSSSPNLTFGNTRCTLQSVGVSASTDNFTWSCMYPPPMGDTAVCATSLSSWLSDITMTSASPINSTEVLAIISPFLSLAGDSIMSLFPGADPALGLGLKFMQQVEAATKEAAVDVGASACDVLHEYDSDDLVIEDSGALGTQTIGSFMALPPPAIAINLEASATASITALPPRKANPTDNFLKQIATDFSSIFGAFTSWLGGLPGLLVEETGSVRLRPVASTPTQIMAISSIATLATMSLVRIQIPTVTVTHILGDGWLNPSTYVLGSGTSTMPQIPTMSADESDSTALITSGDDFSMLISSPTYASSNIIDHVVSQIAALSYSDAGIQTGHRWDLPASQKHGTGTTTIGASLGYDGHIVVVTTTITITNNEYRG